MNKKNHSLLAIGRVSKAFGIRGEVVVSPMTESTERFKKLKRVYLGKSPGNANRYTVEYAQVEPRGVRLKFVETADRTSAEFLVGSLVLVDEQQSILPKEGAYFIHDIVGMIVMDENNNRVGTVKDVLRFPAQDLYVIERNGTEWMIPAVKEFVTSIDVKGRIMRVRLIEGLLN